MAPPGTKRPAATLDPSAAKSKKSLNKDNLPCRSLLLVFVVPAAPGTNKPTERAAPAAVNLDPSPNDQVTPRDYLRILCPSKKSGREEKKTRGDTILQANRLPASEKSYLKKILATQNEVESRDS
ncbi:unnamed protein product [Ectocarpus sp. 4 AP-2014]